MKEGCDRLGWDFRTITRNADRKRYDADLAGLMGFGDVTGAKLGTLKTYLQDAADAGARFVVNCNVQRVLVENGRAAGVEGTYLDDEGRRASVVVRAPTVVLAAGALDTPAVLLRSGIGGPAAGDYLRLHPASAMPAVYDEPQKAWWGPPQTALSAEFADVGDGYGFLIETAHASPAVTGSSVPWVTGQQHKEYMAQAPVTSSLVLLIRDRGHGRVTIDGAGNPVHTYDMHGDAVDVQELPPRPGGARAAQRGRRRAGDLHAAPQADALVAGDRRGHRGLRQARARRRAGSLRARHVLAASHGIGADGEGPRHVGGRPVGPAARHARASGSATRAPSPARPARTR